MSRNTDRPLPHEIVMALIDPESDCDEDNEDAVNNISHLPNMTMGPHDGAIGPLDIPTTTSGETDTHHSPLDLRTMSENETINPLELLTVTLGGTDTHHSPTNMKTTNDAIDPIDAMDFQPSQSMVNRSIRGSRARSRRVIATEKKRRGSLRKSRGALSTRGARALNGESECQRGQNSLEVCSDDQDVSPISQIAVNDMDNARAKRLQGTNDRRHNERAKEDNADIEDHQDEHFDEAKELLNGGLDATVFNWASMDSFNGCPEKFQRRDSGPTVRVTSAYEAFRIYWNDDILQHIVGETNRYAEELSSISGKFARDWVDTNIHEILILFAFWMMTGVIKMPSIKSCFSTNPLLKTGIFRSLLTESRYWNLNRALHFVNNETRTHNPCKLSPLVPLIKHLNSKFQQAYNLHQNIVIDESLILCKGTLSFKQYIKREPVQFGIKSFDLRESNTGYIWSFLITMGKDYNSGGKTSSLKATNLVVQLMKPLLNKGHTLFLNSLFTSPLLARYLKKNKTDCVGTLQKSRKHVPPLIKQANLSEGAFIAYHSGDVVVMAYQDKKTVYTISTYHGETCSWKPGPQSHNKPEVIADYHRSMGGVDRKDMMLEPYLLESKRGSKWYKKMFRQLLNASIFNSRILVDQSSAEGVKQLAYRLELVNSIINQHLPHVPKPRRHQTTRSDPILPLRFSGNQHFIVRSEVDGARTVGSSRSSAGRVGCFWCQLNKKKTKKTVYKCKSCDVPLCLEGCFESFHTP